MTDCLLHDATRLIYVCPDASAGIYDGGAPLAYQGDTDDLWKGSTPPGSYRTDKKHGLIQLGAPPAFNVRNTPPTPDTPPSELAGIARLRLVGERGSELKPLEVSARADMREVCALLHEMTALLRRIDAAMQRAASVKLSA